MKTIPLTQGFVTLVDDADYEWLLNGRKWYVFRNRGSRTFYATRHTWIDGKRVEERMHRVIMGLFHKDQRFVDHIDGDGLNNTRANIRFSDRIGNAQNRGIRRDNKSGYRGVYWHARRRVWVAKTKFLGRDYHIGYFASPDRAARAYDSTILVLHGEFARINFPGHGERGV